MSASFLTDVPQVSLAATKPAASPGLDLRRIREEFPILRQKVHGKPLVYLDNAATTQKPLVVLEALRHYYSESNANIHRAVHQLSERATRDYEAARGTVQQFLGARQAEEIVFVRGATEGINLVAFSWGRKYLRAGDEILVSEMEHHANIVPWQLLCEQTGAVLRVIPINEDGELLLDEYERLLNPRTRLVSIVHLSNSLGTINPVERIIEMAHAHGARVLVDAAQSVSHLSLDVQQLDCDWLVFSGHKVYGPTGIGVLYGKAEVLHDMPPWQAGGDMIDRVSFQGTTYAPPPSRFEAGTPHIAGAIGLAAALGYLQDLGLQRVAEHEDALMRHATARLQKIPGVRIVGNALNKAAALSFLVENPPLSPLDIGTRLDLEGVAVRTGHHCCQPLMDRLGISGTTRASFAVYNTLAEVDFFADVLSSIVAENSKRRSLNLSVDHERCPAEITLCGGAANTCPPRLEIQYAPAAGESPQAVAREILEVFDFLDDWNDRYQYLIELGEKLPPMPAELKTECARVHGCQSVVWLSARRKPGSKDVLEFLADSDAELVRGLIGLLEKLFSGQRAGDVMAFDVEEFFRKLGLDQHLSLNRRNGLAAMVQRIRQHAQALCG